MIALTQKAAAAPFGEPSPLLQHLAGGFAPRIAGLWRAPHATFLTAPAERRHLVCAALARAGAGALPIGANWLLDWSFQDAAAASLAGAPAGLRRALGHLGETAWTARDYLSLLRLLALDPAAKTLRHAALITPDHVHALGGLPEALVRGKVGAFGLTADQARLLSQGYDLVAKGQNEAAAREAMTRWAKAGSAKRLFEMVGDDILPEPPAPPFTGTVRLRPLATKAAIRDAAKRYRNCLKGYVRSASAGDAAFYEWVGPPGAIVGLWTDPLFGWRLNEAKLVRNASVPAALREAIVAEVRAMGVHTGATAWQVQHDLSQAHEADFRLQSPEEILAEAFE
jgi:hypothetical protein